MKRLALTLMSLAVLASVLLIAFDTREFRPKTYAPAPVAQASDCGSIWCEYLHIDMYCYRLKDGKLQVMRKGLHNCQTPWGLGPIYCWCNMWEEWQCA